MVLENVDADNAAQQLAQNDEFAAVANVAEGDEDDEELKSPVSGSIIEDVVVTAVGLKQLVVDESVVVVVEDDGVVIDGIDDVPLQNGWEGVDQVVVASCLHRE